MTIVQKNKDRTIKKVIRLLILAVIVGSFASVFLYNQTVKARQKASQEMTKLETLQLENAQLKNQFYAAVDSENLIAAATRLGLVKDQSPQYLQIDEKEEIAQANLPNAHLSVQ